MKSVHRSLSWLSGRFAAVIAVLFAAGHIAVPASAKESTEVETKAGTPEAGNLAAPVDGVRQREISNWLLRDLRQTLQGFAIAQTQDQSQQTDKALLPAVTPPDPVKVIKAAPPDPVKVKKTTPPDPIKVKKAPPDPVKVKTTPPDPIKVTPPDPVKIAPRLDTPRSSIPSFGGGGIGGARGR